MARDKSSYAKRHNASCPHTSHYRVWIYGFNAVVVSLVVVFVLLAHNIFSQNRLHQLFSLKPSTDFALTYVYVGPTLQFALCILGILATVGSNAIALQTYWYLSAMLILCDVAVGLAWVPRFKSFHKTVPLDLAKFLRTRRTDPAFCAVWNKVQEDLNCCGVVSYSDWFEYSSFCDEPLFNGHRLPHSCCAINEIFCNTTLLETKATTETTVESGGCAEPLLKWLHFQGDILFIVGYCALFVVKFMGLVILRREIRELLSEIYHERECPKGMRRFSDFIGGGGENEFIDVGKVKNFDSYPFKAIPSTEPTTPLKSVTITLPGKLRAGEEV